MRAPRAPGGTAFWLCLPVGAVASLFGVWTFLQDIDRNDPVYAAGLAIGANLAHDVVVAPIACIVGYAVHRFAPNAIRRQISWALFATAVVLLIGYPPWRGYGRLPDNPSVLPLDYTTAILTVLGTVWAIAAVWALVSIRRAPRRRLNQR